MNDEISVYILEKGGIITRGHGKFVTLKNKKGEYTVFRDMGHEVPEKRVKTRLGDFPAKFLSKTASHCRELLLEDVDFQVWKLGCTIGKKEAIRRIRKMTDEEILTEWFGVEK